MSKKITTEYFIKGSTSKHCNGYDYGLVDYKNAKTEVILICKNQHKFEINQQKNQKIKDKIKDNFCKNNNIKLIRIPYYEFDNIEKILNYSL